MKTWGGLRVRVLDGQVIEAVKIDPVKARSKPEAIRVLAEKLRPRYPHLAIAPEGLVLENGRLGLVTVLVEEVRDDGRAG